MKKHLNDVLMIKQENLIEIDKLINQEKILEKLIINIGPSLLDNQSEAVPEENIEESKEKSVINEKYRSKMECLKRKNDEQKDKLQVENEYTNSLINMIRNEKCNMKNSEDNYNEYKERFRKINLPLKNIELNIKENSNKNTCLLEMNKGLKDEIERMHGLINTQKNKLGYLSFSLDKQKTEILKKKDEVKEKNMVKEREMTINKEEMKIKILETERMKVRKLNDENRISRIILGLDLIKRYFYTEND